MGTGGNRYSINKYSNTRWMEKLFLPLYRDEVAEEINMPDTNNQIIEKKAETIEKVLKQFPNIYKELNKFLNNMIREGKIFLITWKNIYNYTRMMDYKSNNTWIVN